MNFVEISKTSQLIVEQGRCEIVAGQVFLGLRAFLLDHNQYG